MKLLTKKKRKRRKLDMGHGEEVDQQLNPVFVATIDCLPDDLLVQILSLLPMKQAASTSVLSKRWRTLFAFTHKLDFDDSIVMGDVWDDQNIESFWDFASRTLALKSRDHPKKFSLRLKENYCAGDVDVVNHWICYALKTKHNISHGFSKLHLCIETHTPLLSRVFTSTTLAKLSLGREFYMDSFRSHARKDLTIHQLYYFVYRTLALQGGNYIKKLSLTLKDKYKSDDGVDVVNYLICYALKQGVSELHLCIKDTYTPFLSRVFTSTTLVKLFLGRNFYIDSFPPNISLPALKVLILDSIWFKGYLLFGVLLAACPVLEDLTIHNMYYPEASYVISSKTIKKLSITYDSFYKIDRSSILSLDTPSLVDLYYSGFPRRDYPNCHLDSLDKATLELQFIEDHKHREQNNVDVTNLMRAISNVKTLHLTYSTAEVIFECCKGELLVFNNLVDLVFSSENKDWKVLLLVMPLLLKVSPNLKTLALEGLHGHTFKRREFVGIRIPPNNQINMLSITDYRGSKDELKHINHFIMNMECLELVKVCIATTIDGPKRMLLTKDLMKLSTASSKLKIEVF